MSRVLMTTAGLLLCVVAVFVQGQFIFEIQQHFEFEDLLTENQSDFWTWRSEAYDFKTLRLEDMNRTYTIELKLCIDPYLPGNVTVFLHDIRYSNDGPSDVIYISISGIPIGNFTTHEEWQSGHEWNIFRNSGVVGPRILFQRGTYTLEIEVQTDKWGVELDRIRMNAENQNPLTNIFCGGRLYSKADKTKTG